MRNTLLYKVLPVVIGLTVAASSCTSDMEPEALESGEELQVEVVEASSRSVVSTTSNLKSQPFMICGDMIRTGEYNPGLKVIFNGRKVSHKNDKWDYGTPIYWLMGQEHSFVAIHPYLDSNLGISEWSYSDSELRFTYTVPQNANKITDYDKVKDILYASHRRKYSMVNAGAIKFEFRHLMSQINIEPALNEILMYPNETDTIQYPFNAPEYIQIKQIEFYGLKTTAKFSFKPAPLTTPLQKDSCLVSYEVDDTSMTHAVMSFGGAKIVTNDGTNVNICNNDDTLLVLPQTVDKSAKIVLYYTVNGDHTENELIRKITFPLSNLPITKWECGKIYSYRFTIEQAYTGQIKPGSIEWQVKDRSIPGDNNGTDWISSTEIISQDFDMDDNY